MKLQNNQFRCRILTISCLQVRKVSFMLTHKLRGGHATVSHGSLLLFPKHSRDQTAMLLMFQFRSDRCLLSRFPTIQMSVITIGLVLSPSDLLLNFTFSPLCSPLPGTRSSGLEHSGCETDHSFPSSCKLKVRVELHLRYPTCLQGLVLTVPVRSEVQGRSVCILMV